MPLRTLVLAIAVLASPALASAQTVPAAEPPSFGPSIALHVSAVSAALLGTGAFVGAISTGLSCSFGGTDCSGTLTLSVIGGLLLAASVTLGIFATTVHGTIRGERQRMAGTVSIVPLLWGDATSGGGGFSLLF